jgi:hypothetical protein
VYGQNIDHKPDLFGHKLRVPPKFTAKILTINLIFLIITFGTWEVTKFTTKTLTINLIFSTHKLRDVPKFTAKTGQNLFSLLWWCSVFCLLSVLYLYLNLISFSFSLCLLILYPLLLLAFLFSFNAVGFVLKMSLAPQTSFSQKHTNLNNKGLISTDRGTWPLSCVQYLVKKLSHIQKICLFLYLKLFL